MKKFLALLIIVAAVGAAWLLLRHRQTPAEDEKEKGAAKVETILLARQSIAQTLEVFGVVSTAASGEHAIAAPYDCVVQKVFASVGKSVEAGEVLLEITPSNDSQLALDSARSAAVLASKLLAATQERFDLKLATNQELLAAQQTADDAKLKVLSFEARGLGGDGMIKATEAGIVSKLEIAPGSQIPLGTALVSVSTRSLLEVRLGVEASDLSSVTPGQTVTLSSTNRPDLAPISALTGTVGASLDTATGAAEVRVPLAGLTPLMPGEHVRAQIELHRKNDTLVVPRSAVLPDDNKVVLYTVKEGKAVRHEVKLGITTDDLVELLSDDLHPGDRVVTQGNYELENGMAVQAPETEKSSENKNNAKPLKEEKP